MIKVFSDPMKAHLFRAQMESEGKHAYVLDEHSPFMYGPIAVSHVRVLVCEEEEIEYAKDDFKVLRFIYEAFWRVVMVGLGLIAFILLLDLFRRPELYLGLGILLLVQLACFVCFAIIGGAIAYRIYQKQKNKRGFIFLAYFLAIWILVLAFSGVAFV